MFSSYEPGTRCWVKSKEQGWVGAQVQEARVDGGACTLVLTRDDDGSTETVTISEDPSNEVPLRNPPILEATSDLVTLSYQNEPSVLHAIRQRYAQLNIYTFSGIVLIATNPFDRVDNLYTNEVVQMYNGRPKGELEPHLFSIAEDAFRCMQRDLKNQTIVVSGESGAGKTVSAKYIMRYFATVENPMKKGSDVDDGGLSKVEREILATNPIMEAFGNAKTTRNDNSSRFGKYLEIRFNEGYEISGARIRTYLLERSRLVSHPESERNYHVFYQLLSGLPEAEREALGLPGDLQSLKYVNQGQATIDGVDDAEEFQRTSEALAVVGVDTEQQRSIHALLAALLHIGNIELRATSRGVLVSSDDPALAKAAQLLGIDASQLAKWLAKKQLQMRSEVIVSDMDAAAAAIVRDSLAKYLYASLFDWLVNTINAKLYDGDGSDQFIGVLDIYGFEHFKQNSFEQFCINYANEKLQQEFNQHVFKLEQEEYAAEEIDWTYIDFVDNEPCITLIEGKMGILGLLDEESRLRQGSDDGFCQKLYAGLGENPHFSKPRLGQSAFVVSHYAHDVEYETTGFLEKNRDTIPDTIIGLLNESKNEFVQSVLATQTPAPAPEDKKDSADAKKLGPGPARGARRPTLGNMFKTSLTELMDTISATNAHYIRCIKPNEQKQAWTFDGPLVLNQLRACGVLETIRISSKGFPGRWLYEEFASRYKLLVHSSKRTQSPRDLSLTILEEFSPESERKLFALGKQKVFLRAGMLAQLENKRTKRQADAAIEIQRFVKMRTAKRQYVRAVESIRLLQASSRGKLARVRYERALADSSVALLQAIARGRLVRSQTTAAQQAVVRVQTIARAQLAQRRARDETRARAATRLQSLARAHLARAQFAKRITALATIQSMVRRKDARAQLEQLKNEKATTEQYEEQQHYEMENKVVELQNALTLKRDEHRSVAEQLTASDDALKSVRDELDTLKVAHEALAVQSAAKVAELQQAIEQHRDNADALQQQLSERIVEIEALHGQLSGHTEATQALETEIATLRAANAQLESELAAAAAAVPPLGGINRYHRLQVPNDDGSLERQYKELVIAFSTEYERSDEATTANLALENRLRGFDALRDEVVNGLVHNLSIPTRAQDAPPIPRCDVLFPGNVFNVLVSEMWRFGLLSESKKAIGSILRAIQDKVVKLPIDQILVATPFWLSNLHQLYSFISLVEYNLHNQNNENMSDLEREQYMQLTQLAKNDVSSAIFNIYFVYMRDVKKHIYKWIVPAVVEAQSIPGFKTETPKRMLGFFPTKGESEMDRDMDRLIMFLNKMHLSLSSYYLEDGYVHAPLMETLSLIAVRSFNDMIMRQHFLSWKRGVQINYNVTRLDEWCKGHDFPQGGQPLESIMQASKLLQLKKNYEADASVIYDICWNLSPAQIHKFLTNYEIEDYESAISPKVTEYVQKRMREDASGSKDLLFPLRQLNDAGPFEVQPPRQLEKLEPYLPEWLNLPKLRDLLELTTRCFSLAEEARKLAEERARLEVYGGVDDADASTVHDASF